MTDQTLSMRLIQTFLGHYVDTNTGKCLFLMSSYVSVKSCFLNGQVPVGSDTQGLGPRP